jgi:hypothetical protein
VVPASSSSSSAGKTVIKVMCCDVACLGYQNKGNTSRRQQDQGRPKVQSGTACCHSCKTIARYDQPQPLGQRTHPSAKDLWTTAPSTKTAPGHAKVRMYSTAEEMVFSCKEMGANMAI